MTKKRRFTKAQQAQFIEHMREGMRRGAAANALGLERRLVLDFIAENEDFEKAVLDAEGQATEHVEEALYQAAVSGSVPAAKLWLDLRQPRTSTALAVTGDQPDELAALMALSGAGSSSDADE